MSSDGLPREAMTRSAPEIAKVLQTLVSRETPILSHVARGTLQFVSRLRHVDPEMRFLVFDKSADDRANDALVSRLRAIFSASMGDRYFEFACGDVRRITHAGVAAISAAFPDILTSYSRRADPRATVSPPLHCLADASGDMPFDAEVVDISAGGIGLLYPADISLEPGTPLSGCVITGPRLSPCVIDLEVRYSQTAMLSESKSTQRSGCRFVQPSAPAVKQLVNLYLNEAGP